MAVSHCTICDELATTRYIDLYTVGSEGTRLCHDCEMLVVEFIRDKKRSALQEKMRKHKEKVNEQNT